MLAQLGRNYQRDTSAQEYLKEAYAFTNQMKSIIGEITLGDIVDVNKEDLGITGDIGNQSIMDFNTFAQHKQQVIRNSINTNLRATIAKFNENSTYPAKMPTLTENEWSMILSNTCLISFMQGQNIGNGYYMGYSIVTNNKNREFVDPKLIYIPVSYTHLDVYKRQTYSNVLLLGILIIFEIFIMDSMIDGMVDKIDNNLLKQQLNFFGEIRHAYHEFNMVEEAIYQTAQDNELEVSRQAEKIYEILSSDEPEMELEKYYDVAPNSYLKEFAGISYLTKEYGDRKQNGASLYLKNLNNITQEMQLEILKRDKLEMWIRDRLYPSFKLTPTSEATSYLNLSKAFIASGTNFLFEFEYAILNFTS